MVAAERAGGSRLVGCNAQIVAAWVFQVGDEAGVDRGQRLVGATGVGRQPRRGGQLGRSLFVSVLMLVLMLVAVLVRVVVLAGGG
jgi:hypothetical protein